MSFFNNVSQLFTKKKVSQLLGISLRKNSLSYCYIDDKNHEQKYIRCKQLDNISSDYGKVFKNFAKKEQVKGRCSLVLAHDQYQIVQIVKPAVPEEEIASALKWQVKDLVPYSPDNMVVDYFYGPKLPDGSEKLYVVCAPLNELQKLVSSINSDDITLESIIVEEFAFSRLLPLSDDAQLMVCQKPNEEVFILIVQQGRICFYRHLRGFAYLADKNKAELTSGIIDNLSLEIQKSTDYFERQLKQPVIKAIKVILPNANEDFIISKLAENTHVSLSALILPEGFENYRQMAAAIGATMPDKAELLNKTNPQNAISIDKGINYGE
jgi:MSHA biogenesis protein MshI